MAAVSVVGVALTLVALPEPKCQTLEEASGESDRAVELAEATV